MHSDGLYTRKRDAVIPNTFSTVPSVRTWSETVCNREMAYEHTSYEEIVLGYRFASLTWQMHVMCHTTLHNFSEVFEGETFARKVREADCADMIVLSVIIPKTHSNYCS